MLKDSESISFIATLNADSSRAFYQQVLGLNLLEDQSYALVFDLNGHALRIAKVKELVPAAHTVHGWYVDNIEDTIKELIVRGVVFEIYDGMQQDALGVWVSPSGAKVAWFKDPDGNILSVTQLVSS